jgi:DNA modification methylase
MRSQKLAIQYLSVGSLRPDPKNARQHSDKQVQQIARSIEAFGFNVPVLVDADLRVVAGHGRLLACKRLGIAQVPVVRLEHLSEHQIRAFMIADNRLTENGDWDDRLLGEQFKILSEAEIDFKLEVTGFETSEIDLFLENLAPASDGQADPGDVLPEASSVQVSRNGDLWRLGKHQILCGDSLFPASYERLMGGQKAQMVFIDPPDNDPIYGYVSALGKVQHPEFAMASGERGETEYASSLAKLLGQLAANSIEGALQFICLDWRHTSEVILAARSVYTEFTNLCVWVKENGEQGSLYRNQHELVFVFKCGKGIHRNNIQLRQYGRHRTNVWRYRHVNSLCQSNEEGGLSEVHPTIKPVELVADAILDCTARGEVVLDAFLGSGTTVIAAERTGRVCYAMELDPRHVDTAIRRWEHFTGLVAVHEMTGQSFAQRENGSADGCE